MSIKTTYQIATLLLSLPVYTLAYANNTENSNQPNSKEQTIVVTASK